MDFMCIISCSIILLCLFSFQPMLIFQAANNTLETYIVYVQSPEDVQLETYAYHDQKMDLESWYHSFLPTSNIGEELELESESRLVHSIKHVFNGFAVKLTRDEVKEMEKKKGFISAQVQGILSMDTTHSPDFMGLKYNSGLWKDSNYGKGVIIGMIDTGITLNHSSFSGNRIPSPPAKWKGTCQFSRVANPKLCNNKLIGVRFVNDALRSASDKHGHGTHSASIAAGNYVRGANVYKNAKGLARGVAPLAHLAIYKTCHDTSDCFDSDVLAAMDLAIEDGVDIISIPYSSDIQDFHMNPVAIGAFSAIERGIFISVSSGNNGPKKSTLRNQAPWMLVVGATTTDRNTIAIVKLGNNVEFVGQSIYQEHGLPSTMLPLVYPGSLKPVDHRRTYCFKDIFKYIDIKGKLVVCVVGGEISRIDQGHNVKAAGGSGMILINDRDSGYTIIDDVHVLPAVHLSFVDGNRLARYIQSSSSPTAALLYNGTSIDLSKINPVLASFSSRGPSTVSPGIIKPDIVGPGVNILGAWPFSIEKKKEKGESTFNIKSGTSFACAHLSGVAALLKSAHPDWSPAAIMSAIITTANNLNGKFAPIEDEKHDWANLYATGAGHVNPTRANDPGLVYLIHQITDYLSYLCGLKYTSDQVSKFAKRKVTCSKETSIREAQLNYPSISVFLGSVNVIEVFRTVTNVGDAVESYNVWIIDPPGVSIRVNPHKLNFTQINQNLTYKVTFTKLKRATRVFADGMLAWASKKHIVTSQIAIIFK